MPSSSYVYLLLWNAPHLNSKCPAWIFWYWLFILFTMFMSAYPSNAIHCSSPDFHVLSPYVVSPLCDITLRTGNQRVMNHYSPESKISDEACSATSIQNLMVHLIQKLPNYSLIHIFQHSSLVVSINCSDFVSTRTGWHFLFSIQSFTCTEASLLFRFSLLPIASIL